MTVKLDAAQDIETWSSQKHFENIPVWDRDLILLVINSFKKFVHITNFYP